MKVWIVLERDFYEFQGMHGVWDTMAKAKIWIEENHEEHSDDFWIECREVSGLSHCDECKRDKCECDVIMDERKSK